MSPLVLNDKTLQGQHKTFSLFLSSYFVSSRYSISAGWIQLLLTAHSYKTNETRFKRKLLSHEGSPWQNWKAASENDPVDIHYCSDLTTIRTTGIIFISKLSLTQKPKTNVNSYSLGIFLLTGQGKSG